MGVIRGEGEGGRGTFHILSPIVRSSRFSVSITATIFHARIKPRKHQGPGSSKVVSSSFHCISHKEMLRWHHGLPAPACLTSGLVSRLCQPSRCYYQIAPIVLIKSNHDIHLATSNFTSTSTYSLLLGCQSPTLIHWSHSHRPY